MKKDYDSTRIYRNTHKKRVRHRLMTHPHDPSNCREAFVKTLKQLKSYGWEIFKGKGAFDLDKAIKDIENLLKK